ncbi:MAG TPA: hypothetical protein VLW44_05340 [Streptosporangiaceae bacterium]|nr:hypothetical protein [Streptosporangiaceae bacterium]
MSKGTGEARRVLRAWLGAGAAAALMAGCGASHSTATPAGTASASQGSTAPQSTASSTPSAASNSPAPGGFASLAHFFPIGVYVQPADSFGQWKSRGVNTMVVVPQGSDETAWNRAAIRDGLFEIRAPASNPASDIGDKHLLAWALPDQPDDITSQVSHAAIRRTYLAWKHIDPSEPVYINFNGQFNQYDLKTRASGPSWYQQYVHGANWISADLYPVNNGDGNDLGSIGQEVTELRQIAGSKPVFVFIESGAYDAGNPVVTPAQFRAEVWEAIIHGARGIFYFPVQVSPSFQFDVTPPAVAAEMTKQDATITKLASVLQGTINPPSLGATATPPLQVAWRSSSGHSYFFVLNLSDSTLNGQLIKLTGVGSATSAAVYGENRTVPIRASTLIDNFGPYAIHIYEIPPAG